MQLNGMLWASMPADALSLQTTCIASEQKRLHHSPATPQRAPAQPALSHATLQERLAASPSFAPAAHYFPALSQVRN
jgi:hypothetical protein